MAEESAAPAAAESTTEELQEKKVKLAFLEKFKLAKKNPPEGTDETKTVTTASPDEVAEQIYRQLAEIKGNDYIVIRLRKRNFLMLAGLLVGLMWLALFSRWGVEKYVPRYAFWNPGIQQAAQPTVAPETSPSPTPAIKIRIRNNNKTPAAAQTLAELLRGQGYPDVEVVEDPQSDYAGVSLITKPNNATLREALTALLISSYTLSSPSAELTVDSDFDAVILFSPNKKAAVPTRKATPTASPSATPQAASSAATFQ